MRNLSLPDDGGNPVVRALIDRSESFANLPTVRCSCGGEQDVRECHVTHPAEALDLTALPVDLCKPCRRDHVNDGLLVLVTRGQRKR